MLPRPADAPMYYGEVPARGPLARHVDVYWHFRVADDTPPIEHHVPPDGAVSLYVDLSEARVRVAGPRTAPARFEVTAGTAVWGVRFWPGAAASLLPIHPPALHNSECALDAPWTGELCGRLARTREEADAARAWEEALLPLAAAARPLDERVLAAAGALLASRGRAALAGVAAQVGLSPRQLRRRFREAVGLSPKELARALRARAAIIAALEGGDRWSQVAARFGYTDEAHLSRELKRIGGLAPAALRRHLERIDHGGVRR